MGFPGGSDSRESACNAGDLGSIPGSEKEMATHSSVLTWRIHGQRSLVGYSLWGHKETFDLLLIMIFNVQLFLIRLIAVISY